MMPPGAPPGVGGGAGVTRKVWGVILVVLGSVLLSECPETSSGELLMVALSVGFITAYFLSGHRTVWLVAGALTGVPAASSVVSGRYPGEVSVLLPLALAFLAIWAIEHIVARRGRWALYLGGFLAVYWGGVYAGALGLRHYIWPLVLVGAGVLVLIRSTGDPR